MCWGLRGKAGLQEDSWGLKARPWAEVGFLSREERQVETVVSVLLQQEIEGLLSPHGGKS